MKKLVLPIVLTFVSSALFAGLSLYTEYGQVGLGLGYSFGAEKIYEDDPGKSVDGVLAYGCLIDDQDTGNGLGLLFRSDFSVGIQDNPGTDIDFFVGITLSHTFFERNRLAVSAGPAFITRTPYESASYKHRNDEAYLIGAGCDISYTFIPDYPSEEFFQFQYTVGVAGYAATTYDSKRHYDCMHVFPYIALTMVIRQMEF